MKRNKLHEIEELLALKFRKKQSAMHQIVKNEERIRQQLLQLDRQAREAEDTQHSQMQAIGADVIWKAWVGRTKTAINLELAQVLAQKEILLRDVRRDFGKLQISRELLDTQKAKDIKAKNAEMLRSATERHLFL